MLDFKYKAFFSTARFLSFSKAAKELSLSQPAISFQIRHLEDELKTRLFVRYPNRIELTATGAVLFKELAHLEQESEKARQRIMEKLGQYWGAVVAGASTTIGDFFLPPVIAMFKRRHPEGSVKVLVGNTDQALGYLSDGIVDFAIVEGPVPGSRKWAKEEVFRDELVVIARRNFHAENEKFISAARVAREPFISREPGSGTRAVTDSLLIGNKPLVPPQNIVLELGSSTAIKKGVEAGLGISIMSVMTLENELRLGVLKAFRISRFPMHRSISFVFQRGMKRTAMINDFAQLCREHGKRISSRILPGRR